MPVPSNISDLSKVASENSPAGTETAKGTIDDYFRAGFAFIRQLSDLVQGPTVSLASAATVNIGFAASQHVSITGATTITAFDNIAEGTLRWVTFSGTLTLTHNPASLQLPGAASIVTAAGDVAVFKSLGAGNWKCMAYQRMSGAAMIPALPLTGGTMSGNITFVNNGPGIMFKDAGGTLRSFAYIGPDDFVNLFNSGGKSTRIVNQENSRVLWAIDNSGNTNQVGQAVIDTSATGGARGLKIVNAAASPEMAFIGALNTKSVRLNGNTLEWVNSAYSAVIMSLSDAGVLSAPVITETSDERKKKCWRRLPADLIERLAGIKKAGTFRWKKGDAAAVGIGAQSLEAIIPEAIYTDEAGGKAVNTGGAAMAILIDVARELMQVRARLAKLEAK